MTTRRELLSALVGVSCIPPVGEKPKMLLPSQVSYFAETDFKEWEPYIVRDGPPKWNPILRGWERTRIKVYPPSIQG